MRTSLAIIARAGCACLLLLPGKGRAEPVTAESIEWVLATSDRVVVGKVVKVDTVTAETGQNYQAITVAISRTLKGASAERDTFLVPPYVNTDFARQWMDEGVPIVFCAVKTAGPRAPIFASPFAWVLRDNHNGTDTVLLGKSQHEWTGCIPVLTHEFDVLTDSDKIVNYLEKTVKASPNNKDVRSHQLEVPVDTAVFKRLYFLGTVHLIVPVDEQLEAAGRRWCRSESGRLRAEGAKALGYFNSRENADILRSMLNDPASMRRMACDPEPGQSGSEPGRWTKVYYVRQAAFDSLRKFGAPVNEPILTELLEGQDDPGAEPGGGPVGDLPADPEQAEPPRAAAPPAAAMSAWGWALFAASAILVPAVVLYLWRRGRPAAGGPVIAAGRPRD
jgi:hypothetical protein